MQAKSINVEGRDAVSIELDVPLSGLKPGPYVCQLNVIDDAGGQLRLSALCCSGARAAGPAGSSATGAPPASAIIGQLAGPNKTAAGSTRVPRLSSRRNNARQPLMRA